MGQYLSNVLYAKEVKQSKSKLTRSIILPCSKSLNRLLLLTTMRCLAIVLSALTLLGSQSTLTVGASSASRDFFYTFDMTDNSEALDMTVAETHCADACQVGDSIMIAGDLTIYEEFTETLCIKLMIAIQGSTSTATGSGDFCTFANVVSVDGSTECPAPGDYTFEIPMTVTGLSRGTPSQSVKSSCKPFLFLSANTLFLRYCYSTITTSLRIANAS